MTQIFDKEGVVNPVTAVYVEPIEVISLRTSDKNGYEAVQVSYLAGTKKKKLKEFRGSVDGYTEGDKLDAMNIFNPGDVVKVSAISKGKGFQGVVRRYGFGGGPRTHGQKHNERQPGSIGSGLRKRVPKGAKMPGRVGSDRVSIKGTRVIAVDPDQSVIFLHGAVPGRRGTLVEIQGI